MAFVTPKTFAAGEILSADDMNVFVSANTADLNARLSELIDTLPVSRIAYGASEANVSIGSTFTATGASVSITPSSEGAKVLIVASHPFSATRSNNDDIDVQARLKRGSTVVQTVGFGFDGASAASLTLRDAAVFVYVDSPNTETAVTYSLEGRIGNGSVQFLSGGHIVAAQINV